MLPWAGAVSMVGAWIAIGTVITMFATATVLVAVDRLYLRR
jgi:hypothetical protein